MNFHYRDKDKSAATRAQQRKYEIINSIMRINKSWSSSRENENDVARFDRVSFWSGARVACAHMQWKWNRPAPRRHQTSSRRQMSFRSNRNSTENRGTNFNWTFFFGRNIVGYHIAHSGIIGPIAFIFVIFLVFLFSLEKLIYAMRYQSPKVTVMNDGSGNVRLVTHTHTSAILCALFSLFGHIEAGVYCLWELIRKFARKVFDVVANLKIDWRRSRTGESRPRWAKRWIFAWKTMNPFCYRGLSVSALIRTHTLLIAQCFTQLLAAAYCFHRHCYHINYDRNALCTFTIS